MPEPKDDELPREERLFARVPKVTNDKIGYLAERWGLGETLSTADVIIRAVERAYLKAKEARTMSFPTVKKLLHEIRAGKANEGILPVPPGESIGVGDTLTFEEATFSLHQIPEYVPNGESVSRRITKATDTGMKHFGSRLYAFQWERARKMGSRITVRSVELIERGKAGSGGKQHAVQISYKEDTTLTGPHKANGEYLARLLKENGYEATEREHAPNTPFRCLRVSNPELGATKEEVLAVLRRDEEIDLTTVERPEES
jgi:hypothetical protein